MSKSTLSARHTTRLINSYRRASRLARNEVDEKQHRQTCERIAKQLTAGGREDIATDLIAEEFAY